MARRVEQRHRARAFDDASCVHHQHPVACLGHHAEVVGDEQDAHAAPAQGLHFALALRQQLLALEPYAAADDSSGGIDKAQQRPTVEDFDRINASDNARVSATIGNRIVLSAFNYDMEPFGNRKVRQALNYAVNQKEVNDIYLRGMGELMASAIPSTVLGHDPGIELYPYDPEMARSLLKEAGHPNGFETTIEAVPEWMVAGTEVTEAIVHYLREVGVKAKIQIYDAGTMASRITSGKAGPMYMLSWGGNSTFDADSYIGTLMGSGAWSCNSMPEVDKLVAAGRATADQAERIGIYQEACRFIHDDAPWVFLHLQPNTYGASSNHDWEGRPDELIPLWYLSRTA